MDKNKTPNFIFFGTPKFAEIILSMLINNGFIPKAVICNPDKPTGRKKIITPPPVKILAQKHKIKILQPEKLEIKNAKKEIGSFDFAVVASYTNIIPQEILELPKLGTIGVHPSILPRYRGATPIQNAILNGDEKTGVTLYLMDEKIDHGPILKKTETEIYTSDTYLSLHDRLAELGGYLLTETIPELLGGKIIPQVQNETQSTFTKKIKTQDAFINPEHLEKSRTENGEIAKIIDRKIRAFNPEPGTWTFLNGKRTKILEASLKNGNLIIEKIQIEGKTPMPFR